MLSNPYGYACICMTLQEKGIQTGRSLIQKTFNEKGINYVSELAFKNVTDLKKVIEWNIANNFNVFRVTSDLFPWWSKYSLTDLPHFSHITQILKEIGDLCNNKLRLSFHPDHFVKLASDNPEIVENSIKEIDRHSLIFDLMGFAPSHYNKINIHIGGNYNDKMATLNKFCSNFKKLSESSQKRLTVENDDKKALYNVDDLYKYVFEIIGTPIVFDYHHHKIYNGGMEEQVAFDMAYKTWDCIPIFHYSESCDHNIRAHSDYVKNVPNMYNRDVYIMVEAKAKDLAVIELRKK